MQYWEFFITSNSTVIINQWILLERGGKHTLKFTAGEKDTNYFLLIKAVQGLGFAILQVKDWHINANRMLKVLFKALFLMLINWCHIILSVLNNHAIICHLNSESAVWKNTEGISERGLGWNEEKSGIFTFGMAAVKSCICWKTASNVRTALKVLLS